MGLPKEKIYFPTLYEIIYLSLAGASLFIIHAIVSAIKDYDLKYYNFFSTTSKSFIDNKLSFLDTPNWSTILTFALWMICGIMTYLAIWFISIVIRSYSDDSMPLPLHGFLTPRGYNLDNEVFTFIARGLIRFMAIILSFVWLFVLLRSVLPYLTKVFDAGLSPFTFRSPPTMIVASVLMGLSLFLSIVLARFVVLRKRLFSRNITD